jgi:DNA polymerase III delta prime subunit
MYIDSGKITYSPSDLTLFMDSPFASWMEHSALIQPELLSFADKEDSLMSALQHKGIVHEQNILNAFQQRGLNVVSITKNANAFEDTLTAMESGADIIYQAALSLPPFKGYADMLLKEADHLSQIATITKSQIKKMNKAGIETMQAMIDTPISRIKGMNIDAFGRLKAQAKIQKESTGKAVPLYRILPHEAHKKMGLALLPSASPLDIYFDIEGFPLEDGGLEYLWGVTYFDENGKRQYKDYWAHNQEQEKASFKAFIEWTYARWEQNPSMHIYHYANYEIAACRKLMGRYGICEDLVDQLLRNEVFVDLYKIVKGSLLLGEPRYSIKNVEHLYREKRATEVGSGGDSVAVYERWREAPDGETWETSKVLNDIREYNIDDCNSTQELVDWLRLRQKEHDIIYLGKTEIVEAPTKEEITDRIQQRDRLLQKSIQLMEEGSTEEAKVTNLLAWILEFHRREKKPMYWRLFDRMGLSAEELVDDIDCLAQCVRTEKPPYKPTPRARNFIYEYSFDPNQEFKGASEKYIVLGQERADGKNVTVTFIKEDSRLGEGYISLQTGEELEEIINLIPDEDIQAKPIPEALTRQVEAFEQGHLANTAILDFLMRSNPRITGHKEGQPIAPSHDPTKRLSEIIQAAQNLDNSYLTIQGPPGSGKTYTAKHVIAELLKHGKRIGISSNSHKAINHLLLNTAEYCRKEGIKAYFACTKNTDEALAECGINVYKNENIASNLQPACVIGTTAWGFARNDLENAFDYLFIDEAGQVSVANLIAMSGSTKNIILMGDQMQLGQPSQGSHPEDSGLSILDYLLHTTPTIPESMGIFLGTTYRMHSTVNQFISEGIYEGKLESAPDNDNQRIQVPEGYQGIFNKEAGIITIPVFHEGNTQSSEEEVELIVLLANELIGRTFTTKNGTERPIDWKDILFVAPYNHQVNKLRLALSKQAKVGSVDKFQGQEAPIVFLSMCASNANESPRGMDFLFNKNRINVAISRAECMAVVVYSPMLADTVASTIQQMELLNLFQNLINI